MTTMFSTASETVTLKGGAVVSLEALTLLWAMEDRGCVVRRASDGSLQVGPRRLLTDAERERIRRHKGELLMLMDCCEDVQ